jgi:KDO2-lipid IV(A) lauroyltransferase
MSLKTLTRPFRHALLRALLWAVSGLMQRLPAGAARRLGAVIGQSVYWLVPSERRRTLDSLAVGFPEQSPAERKALARRVYANLGMGGADFLRMAAMSPDQLDALVTEVQGLEHLQGLPGAVYVTGHFGLWELMGAWHARRVPLAAIARQAADPRLDQALTRHRERSGMTIFPRNTSVMPILRWLKEGKVLGMLSDQDTSIDSLYCDFFGLPAKTPSGGAFLAQVCGVKLVPMYCLRNPDGNYTMVIEPPIPLPPKGDRDPLALWPAVQEYNRRLEAMIRKYPEQWAWNHARWRSPIGQDSPGWQSRLGQACLDRIEAWRAQGRPELK